MPKEIDKRFKPTGPKTPPVTINLPGGVTVTGFDFRITKVDDDGLPLAFERTKPSEDSDCVLWASPAFLLAPLASDLKRRYESRRAARPADYVTNARDVESLPVTHNDGEGVCMDCDTQLVPCKCHPGCLGKACPTCDSSLTGGAT